jgi:hypothetical protein
VRYGALALVTVAAFACGVYLAGNSDKPSSRQDLLLQQLQATGMQAQSPPIVTVQAFVPPSGSASVPTVPVLATPVAAPSYPPAAPVALAAPVKASPVLAASRSATKVALARGGPLPALHPVASKPGKMISKLEEEEDGQEQGSPSSPALSSQSMDELYREVQELEQQEKLAMATRAAALQKAMSVTSNCPPGDKACGLAHLDVKWKTAKDKYEQV